MRGRYEKPKQKRGKSPAPGSYPAENRSSYPSGGQGGYPPDSQNPYASGNPGGYGPGSQNGYASHGYQAPNPGRSGNGSNAGARNSYSNPNGYPDPNGYPGQGGYADYSQNSGYPGYDPYGSGSPGSPRQNPQEKGRFGWGLLGFLLPLVGLILFLVWKKDKPANAKIAGKGALIGFIFFIVLIFILGIAGYWLANSMMNGVFDQMNQVEVNVTYPPETEPPVQETEAPETTAAPTEPPHVASPDDYINFLVAGQSSRGEGDVEQARFADSMMLVTLNTHEKTLTMTSLLRDTLVHPPDYRGKTFGKIKLTTVYHLGYVYAGNNIAGSMELIDLTLNSNFGIEVDHNFEIDFQMFEQIINKLGGVTVEINQAEADYMNKEMEKVAPGAYGHFSPGTYDFDGFSGLAFARMRHAEGDADSDIKRVSRQQRFLKALLDKVSTMSIADLQAIANEVLPMVSTSMTTKEMKIGRASCRERV